MPSACAFAMRLNPCNQPVNNRMARAQSQGGHMALLEDLAALITAAIPAEITVFYGKEQPSPVRSVTLTRTGGPQADGTLDGAAIRERTVQVRVRDSDPQALDARTDALHALFAAQRPFAGYMGVVAISETFTGYPLDAAGASISSFNVRVTGG